MVPRAITGLGIVSALGIGREAFFAALHEATPLFEKHRPKLETFDASAHEAPQAVEVPAFDAAQFLGDKGLRTLDRLTKLMVVAARLALIDASLKRDGKLVGVPPERAGIVSSNAYGSLEAIVELDRVAKLEDARYINPAKFPNTVSNSASGYVSIWEELRALNVAVSDGTCGALDALACADVYMTGDRADVLVTGGAEAMSEPLFLAFEKFGTLSDRTFLGEGSAFVTLETPAHAERRGATVMARVVGFGTACVPPSDESMLIHPSDVALERAINEALADANMEAAEVDVVASSMLGLDLFDGAELRVLERAFPQRTTLAAPKLMLGETLGAGGAMALACALGWFAGAPPSYVVRKGSTGVPRTALITSMGFYGNASALVVRA